MDIELNEIFQQRKKAEFASIPTHVLVRPSGIPKEPTEARIKKTGKESFVESPERLARTIFVGNTPISVVHDRKLRRTFKALFLKMGPVETIRIRSLVGKRFLSKKIAFITGQISKETGSCSVFVVMKIAKDAQNAVQALNGTLFEGHHLRVDLASNTQKPSTKKSIFVGNLPFNLGDEALWTLFEGCGPILYVRIIRDKDTGIGKGFGYVAFKDKASLELALQLNGSECDGRLVRVSKCAKSGYQKAKKDRLQKNSDQSRKSGKKDMIPITTKQQRSMRSNPSLPNTKHKSNNSPNETISKHPAEIRKENKMKELQTIRDSSKFRGPSAKKPRVYGENFVRKDKSK